MTRKPETIGFWQGRLPHWEVQEGRYFVTIHLHGAIPAGGMARIERMAEDVNRQCHQNSADSSLSLMRTVFRDMEQWWTELIGTRCWLTKALRKWSWKRSGFVRMTDAGLSTTSY